MADINTSAPTDSYHKWKDVDNHPTKCYSIFFFFFE